MSTTELARKVGEYVVYKKHGIYQIADIRKEKICSELRTYYILKSVYDRNATVYVPVDVDALVSQMEHVLTQAEIDSIIDRSKEAEMEWIADTSARFDALEETIGSEDLCRILAMMRMLTDKKEEAQLTKAKTFAHDERMLSASQKIITEAFAFSLGLSKNEVMPYIAERLSTK